MSTIHNIHGDMTAATATLQPTDEFAIYRASDGAAVKITGALVLAGNPGVVSTTATTLSLTATQHANRLVMLNTNSGSGLAVTLPAATGTGNKYELMNGIAQTQGSITIVCAGSDNMKGRSISCDSTAVATHANFFVTLTATTVTWNRTTQGGIGHDHITLWDSGAAVWRVLVEANCSGANATPFS